MRGRHRAHQVLGTDAGPALLGMEIGTDNNREHSLFKILVAFRRHNGRLTAKKGVEELDGLSEELIDTYKVEVEIIISFIEMLFRRENKLFQ